MMKIRIEINEKLLRELVHDYLVRQLGNLSPDLSSIRIEVKSKQNYKSEWESAEFRAVYEK
jgi:hypothetical protein